MIGVIMQKTLVITDVTRMSGDKVCVAGVDSHGNCVRPIMRGDVRESHLYQRGELLVYPRAKVQFDLTAGPISPPHVEDMEFRLDSIASKGICGDVEWENALRHSCFSSVADIFDRYLVDDRYVLSGQETRLLRTVTGVGIDYVEIDDYFRRRYRLDFRDAQGDAYLRVPINDLPFRAYLDVLSNTSGGEMRATRVALRQLRSSSRVYLALVSLDPGSEKVTPRPAGPR